MRDRYANARSHRGGHHAAQMARAPFFRASGHRYPFFPIVPANQVHVVANLRALEIRF